MKKLLAAGIVRWGIAVVVSTFSVPALGQLVDAKGDAEDVFGAGPPLLDIDTISVTFNESTLFVEMTFHTPVSAPSRAMPDGVIGLIEFDVDQDVLTGVPPLQNLWSPPFAFLATGVDYFVDGWTETVHPGFVDIVDATGGGIDTVPIRYGPMSLSLAVPLLSLGADDGVVNFTATMGTIPQPTDATDEVGTSVPGVPPCPWDCDGGESADGTVGIVDFLTLLAQWGGPGSCDFDGGGVGIDDFQELLANWGPCPAGPMR